MGLLNAFATPGTNRRPPSESSWWRAVLTFLLLVGAEARAQTTSAREYEIKAAFLLNFSRFVEWPSDAFNGLEASLVIGVLGDDPFGAILDGVMKDEKNGAHPVVVERYRNADEVRNCHILFINYEQPEQLEKAFETLKGRSVLTVGDTQGFARRGGMIRFMMVNNKIRLRINPEAAQAAGLVLSSKLLKMADIVSTAK